MWPQIQQAQEEKRYELVLTGEDVNKRIQNASGQLDPNLFDLLQLNFLCISKSPLTDLSPEIGQLINLTSLTLQANQITSLPESIVKLEKLKLLDVSMNQLESLPNDIGTLSNLTTLNANNNKISELPNIEKCVNLAVLDFRENCLPNFPDICHETLGHLADVKFTHNQISEVPANLTVLPSLKLLDLGSNNIKVVPGELADCVKLKDVNLKGNPLSDRRFRKLVESERCLPRQVMDYIRQHCPKVAVQNGKGGAGGKGKKGKGKGKGKDQDQLDSLCNELHILSVKENNPVIQVSDAAREVRPYIVCCIIQDVDLSGDNLKKFISAQTKLHEGICEKRMAATIATHDLTKIQSPLKFMANDPNEIRIHPLVRGKEVSARELYDGLQQEAEAQRKQQKRNNVTGIHKFLHLVERWKVWPCLVDATGAVISLPPITNSENTKITQETVNVFAEVTSSTSLGKAKEVADALILSAVQIGISKEKNAASKSVLSVQQIRIEDEEGNLRVIYPSRADLVYENEQIRVVMPEK